MRYSRIKLVKKFNFTVCV